MKKRSLYNLRRSTNKAFSAIVAIILFLGYTQLKPERLLINNDNTIFELSETIEFFEDYTSQLTFEDIQKEEFQKMFHPLENGDWDFGLTKSAFWVRMTITNYSDDNTWFIELSNTMMDYVDCYRLKGNGSFDTTYSGILRQFTDREFKHRNSVFKLNIPIGKTRIIYLRLQSGGPLSFPLTLYSSSKFFEKNYYEQMFFGLFYGAMFLILLYHILIYGATRHKPYLSYIWHFASLMLWTLVTNGFAFQMLWPHAPNFASISLCWATGLTSICMIFFTKSFLRTKEQSPKLNVILNLTILISIIHTILTFLIPEDISLTMTVIIGLLCPVISFSAGVITMQSGYRPTKFFMMALPLYQIGLVLYMFKTASILPLNSITEYSAQFGSALEGILLMFALRARINLMKKQKENAQEQMLQQQKKYSKELEKEVEQRTLRIRKQNIKLEEANDEIKKQVITLNSQAEEIKVANQELSEKNQQLESLNIEKNEILSIAAHDLKNPLSGIHMNAEIIGNYYDKIGKDRIIKSVNEITNLSSRMSDIIRNLLDINAIESGTLHLNFELLDITEIITKVVEIFKKQALAKEISIQLNIKSQSIFVNADRNAIHEIFENLISNAIKYSPKGKNVYITALTHEKTARIIVQDEGPGFTKEDMQKLYSKFARLSAKPTAGENSTGLGLSIVKRLVELQNGNIMCESEFCQGATFIVDLEAVG